MFRRCILGRSSSNDAAAKMIKSYKLFEVTSQCTPHDSVFARKLPGGGCQFFAWPGLSQNLACQGILSMPPHLQTVHSLFGRNDVPMDICADIDCAVPPAIKTVETVQKFQTDVLMKHVTALHDAISAEGESIESQVCLQSPNLKKASFHIHIKLKDAAFADYRSLLGFLQAAHSKGNLPNIDLQIYRPNGMLRMYKSKKENLQSPIGLCADKSLQIGFPSGAPVPDIDAAIHSLCVRGKDSYKRLIQKAYTREFTASGAINPREGFQGADDNSGVKKDACLAPKSKVEACENVKRWLQHCPPDAVKDWKGWLAIGMATFRLAHHFRDAQVASFNGVSVEAEFLNGWIELSKKVPQKFVPGDCEKRWATFSPESREDSWWISYRSLYNVSHGRR